MVRLNLSVITGSTVNMIGAAASREKEIWEAAKAAKEAQYIALNAYTTLPKSSAHLGNSTQRFDPRAHTFTPGSSHTRKRLFDTQSRNENLNLHSEYSSGEELAAALAENQPLIAHDFATEDHIALTIELLSYMCPDTSVGSN